VTYTAVIAAGTPIVRTLLVGFSQLDTLVSPSHSLADNKKADFIAISNGGYSKSMKESLQLIFNKVTY
jgi:hypothetical protein